MAIWGSAASFSSRVATLTGSGGLLQAGVAVFDDDDHDMLVGGAGRDLVLRRQQSVGRRSGPDRAASLCRMCWSR